MKTDFKGSCNQFSTQMPHSILSWQGTGNIPNYNACQQFKPEPSIFKTTIDKFTHMSVAETLISADCRTASPLYCSGRVNLVPLPSVVTSPRDMALAAVICSALATVLLALLVLCVIYCKRQLLEKKPSATSLRSQDCPYSGAELSCLDPRWLHDIPQRPCCQCHLGPGHTCGPVHLIPSLCCDESCSLGRSQDNSPFQSQTSLRDGNTNQDEEGNPAQLRGHPESVPGETAGMTGSTEPAGRTEMDEEEARCRSKENSPERTRQSYNEPDDMDFFGSCSTLEPPWTQQQQRPKPVSDYSPVTPPLYK
ncbi:hypothetical protein PAMP_018820 [Pampus punctatissimus]